MNKTVTVDEAISKGHRMVNYPVMVIMFGIIGLTLYLGVQKLIPTWCFPVGFVLAFILAWLWWSFMITKWRLWAFDNVRNVHELKKRAIQEKLVWADNSIFEKTEIRTATDKEKLSLLQNKFRQDDLFQDDLRVTNETVIYYSKGKNFVEMAAMLGCLGVGIYLLLETDSYILGSILSIVGAYFGFKEYKEATNTEPQIILNDKGIKTISTDFYDWNDIENEEVINEGSGKHTHYYLTYDHPDGAEHLQIDDYDTDQRSLNKLLILYRGRSKKKTARR
ncbi:hypothetical protein [Adhaeribacter rhizoryzae]|uniref:Uncharacterized protein n=1 Tax=Adhaeribacter rhizoryzae TaxID=2607907 RepID=A0A5M6DJ03_9BACT|nr:hypothetical protein [Adhaeribacter rhizoryzae]KAA5547461.1 hypothetical protein F0145_09045 [Adhaeribacter rhizoryzae]